MSDTELGVNYHLRESGSGTESELGLTIGLCVKFKPLAQGNPFLLVTTIPPWLLKLMSNVAFVVKTPKKKTITYAN